jgi:hypothetical protein
VRPVQFLKRDADVLAPVDAGGAEPAGDGKVARLLKVAEPRQADADLLEGAAAGALLAAEDVDAPASTGKNVRDYSTVSAIPAVVLDVVECVGDKTDRSFAAPHA